MTTLERILAVTFSDPVPAPDPDERQSLRDHMTALYGDLADPVWPDGQALVSYHRMARAVVRELGPDLAGVDLVITVDAGPDCRHQSFAGPVLADLLPGEPAVLGVSEQGVAGPFTALRIAWRYLASGAAHRALVVVMEQSTLPPPALTGPAGPDVAVAMVLGPDGTVRLGLPEVTATRSGQRAAAPSGSTCTGVWRALADRLAGDHDGATILVTDRDPVLPYQGSMTVTRPAGVRSPFSPRPLRIPEPVR
ncbi:hypothetical protein [Actinoplanes sp. G11-F43]|uniref:hypothetical protein n=1 Tax=Actinoplanes sp. G11-F43 TaxID=3424130 RepID=UPI003D34C281